MTFFTGTEDDSHSVSTFEIVQYKSYSIQLKTACTLNFCPRHFRNKVHRLGTVISGTIRMFRCCHCIISDVKGELQRENKLISYERAFKMLENDMYITVIGQAVLELLSFKVESGNHQTGISLLQKFSEIFGHMRLVLPKMMSYLTSHNFQILKIEISSKPCKI